MRAHLLFGLVSIAACAPTPGPVADPAALGERRCIASTGAMTAPRCDEAARNCGCEAPRDVLTFIPACGDGIAPSSRWHDATDPARGRAARDGSFVGDRDATGPYCLPAPPR